MDKKLISPHIEWYLKMFWFVHNFLQNFLMVDLPKVYDLSRSYLNCLEYFCFPHLYANTVRWWL